MSIREMKTSPKSCRLLFSAIFFASGCAALIYQVCWQRLLTLYYGVGTVSTAIIVTIFMFGLGIGSLIGGYLSERVKKPTRAYVAIEVLIGAYGLASMPLLASIGHATAGSDYSVTVVYVSLFLFAPTALMGATLPLVISILRRFDPDLLQNISDYYFINTLGAAAGALICSFLLISFFGIDGAILSAVALNFAIAVLIIYVSETADAAVEIKKPIAIDARIQPYRRALPILLFVNGFMAIGYQMIWFRVVSVLLKDSTYGFSIILSIYLLGVGLGSYWLSKRSAGAAISEPFLFYMKLNALVGASALTLLVLLYYFAGTDAGQWLMGLSHGFSELPYIGATSSSAEISRFFESLGLMMLWPLLLILAPTFFMGAAFPVGLAVAASSKSKQTSSVGSEYAWTIAGNSTGGLVSAFLLLPYVGTMTTALAFAALQVGLFFAAKYYFTPKRASMAWATGLAAIGAASLIVTPATSDFYRKIYQRFPDSKSHFLEGVEGTVLAIEQNNGGLVNIINGSTHGGRPGPGYIHETATALGYARNPRRALAIGYGAGALAETVLLDNRVQTLTVAEINRTSVRNLMNIDEVKRGIDNPRLNFVFDDGRRALARNTTKYDLVTMDPLRTRSAFSNNIYSVEFYRLVRQNLDNEGVLLVWTDDKTDTISKTLLETFEYVHKYDFFFVCSPSPLMFDAGSYQKIIGALPDDLASSVKKFQTPMVADQVQLARSTTFVSPNADLKPNLEYYFHAIVPKTR